MWKLEAYIPSEQLLLSIVEHDFHCENSGNDNGSWCVDLRPGRPFLGTFVARCVDGSWSFATCADSLTCFGEIDLSRDQGFPFAKAVSESACEASDVRQTPPHGSSGYYVPDDSLRGSAFAESWAAPTLGSCVFDSNPQPESSVRCYDVEGWPTTVAFRCKDGRMEFIECSADAPCAGTPIENSDGEVFEDRTALSEFSCTDQSDADDE